MQEQKRLGRVADPHPLKRVYKSEQEYFDHQLGKEDSPDSCRGLYPQIQQSCDFFVNLLPIGCREILDIGARDGAATDYFIRHGYFAKGIELSQKLVKHCQSRGIPVVQGDMHHLLFRDNSFDAIFAKDVLEHSYDPPLALIEWTRVLRVGGLMYIECPCLDYNYAFHSYEFTSPEMLRRMIRKTLDVDVVKEREYYTVQFMYSCTVLLKSKAIHYPTGSSLPRWLELLARLKRRTVEMILKRGNF